MKHISSTVIGASDSDDDRSHPRDATLPDIAQRGDGVCGLDLVAMLMGLVTAIALAFNGTLLSHLNADGLLPVLVSTQQWTPFFWGQDRLGMLLPAMTLVIEHPFWTLLAQMTLAGAFTTTAFLLPARFFLGKRLGYLTAVVGLIIVLMLAGDRQIHRTFQEQHQYGFSITLAFLGLTCIAGWAGRTTRWRFRGISLLLGAAILLGFAGWLNGAILISVVPMAAVYAVLVSVDWTGRKLHQRWRVHARLAIMTGVLAVTSLIGNMLFSRIAAEHRSYVGLLEMDQWLDGWQQLVVNSWHEKLANGWGWVLLVGLGLVVVGGWLPWVQKRRWPVFAASVALIVAAGVQLGFFGMLDVVYRNGSRPRYMDPALIFLSTAILGAAFSLWLGKLHTRRLTAMAVVALVALPVLTMIRFGLPSVDEARIAIDQQFGQHTQDILDARCTHIAGSSWTVIPTVFHANLTLHEQGQSNQVWGLSSQTHETTPRWQHIPTDRIRIATIRPSPLGPEREHELAEKNMTAFGFEKVQTLEQRAQITVLTPRVKTPVPVASH